VLYWHWSPNYGWDMNMQLRGWNETMIVYILAIASSTNGVPASLWTNGWAGMYYYTNGGTFYGIPLDVGWDYGGPLFFAHYSFLGFDPRHKKDAFTNYFINNLHHTQINWAYCVDNPKSFTGYSEKCWGLTASDDPDGYMAHEPFSRDNGTITPTAALSSFPYTPQYAMDALKHFYRDRGDRLWGNFGFIDAFNLSRNWYASSYLAIDQGPIIDMIENHRSGLLWNLFMANPEIQPALDAIGFVYDPDTYVNELTDRAVVISCHPNPATTLAEITITLSEKRNLEINLYSMNGSFVKNIQSKREFTPGTYSLRADLSGVAAGIYYFVADTGSGRSFFKMAITR
jgi:hypothetical protein